LVEDFELHRGKRRTRDQMLLPAVDRQNILLEEWKFSQREIQGAIQLANKVKFQRQATMKKENSVFASKFRRGLDLLSERAVPILKIWRKCRESKNFKPHAKVAIPCRSQKGQLDDTKHKQIETIDYEE
jgi:hypothetical protein